VATSPRVVAAIAAQIKVQLGRLARAGTVRHVLARGFLAVEVKTLDQAAAVANYVAPEHLELLVAARAVPRLSEKITTAGAIMIGNDTPTALGDFIAGPSHVLPTGRSGRFFSGLRVAVVAAFAAMEQLDAHGRSVEIRMV